MHHSSRYCSGDQRSHVCDHWGLSGSNSQGEGGSFNSVATRHGGGCIPRTTKGARSSARGGVQGTLLQNSVPCRGYMQPYPSKVRRSPSRSGMVGVTLGQNPMVGSMELTTFNHRTSRSTDGGQVVLLLATEYLLFATCYLLLTTYAILLTTDSLLLAPYSLLLST